MTDLDSDTRPAPEEPRGSKRVGRYDLLEHIGKGGMGVVYRAHDTQLDRTVALKMIITELADEEETRQRFLREARAAADLNHPNIIKIYDFREEAGRAYIVMELLTGRSLAALLEDGKAVPLGRSITIMRGVSAGLAFAHSRAIVHRDLKPGNLFLCDDGAVKILDFGLARIASSKLTRSGLVFGTPDYMSPEQVRGKVVDHRSDIFSFGAVFYHMIAGRKPFGAGSLPLVMRKVLEEDTAPLAEAPPAVARIIAKALRKDPEARYQTTAQLEADLDRVEGVEEQGQEATVLIGRDPAAAAFPQIGRYRIVEQIGRGGMGVVYRAHDPVLERDVAIKSILGDFSTEQGATERFEREARAAARLQHANIITIYELGISEGAPYIVMEFLTGTDLESVMHAEEDTPIAAKVDVVMQLCSGLSFAHRQGVVHCDIKPSNVRVLDDGTVKLIDFGIAKISRSAPSLGDLAGSVGCMSPEQLNGASADARSDVFAVGVLMYELFGGVAPFTGDSPAAVTYQVLKHKPPPLTSLNSAVPEELSNIVARALAKNPDERYEDAAALADALVAGLSPALRPATDGPGAALAYDLDLRSPAGAAPDVGRLAGTFPSRLSLPPAGRFSRRTARAGVAVMTVVMLALVGGRAGVGVYLMRSVGLPSVSPVPPPTIRGPGAVLALSVDSDPPGARILIAGGDYRGIDGQAIELTTPETLPFREAFPAAVELRRPGYEPVEVSVPTGEGPTRSVEAVLDARPLGTVIVSGSYAFEVWSGSRRLSGAATDHNLRLVGGSTTLRLRNRELFLDQRFAVQVTAGERVRLRAPPLGSLTVYSRPGNCEILIDGQGVGFPPVRNRRVAAGSHLIARKCPDAEQNASERRTVSAGTQGQIVRFGPRS